MRLLHRVYIQLRQLLRDLGHLTPLAAALVLMPFVGATLLIAFADPVLAALGTGLPGALLLLAASVPLATLSLIPTHAVSLVAGYLHGGIAGSGLAVLAVTIAAVLGHSLLSRLAGDRLLRALAGRPRAQALHQALLASGPRRTATIVGLLRLSPVMPFAGTNLLMAASAVPLPSYTLGSLVGLAPRVIAMTVAGASLSQVDFSTPGSSLTAGLGIAATIIGLGGLGWIGRNALRERLREQLREPAKVR